MQHVPFSLYDAFSDNQFGGSQGAIVYDAANFSPELRLQIARELGFPATCFVESYTDNSATVRFQSTEREYPMCGHGTICLMSSMIDTGLLAWNGTGIFVVDLHLPSTTTTIEIIRREDNRNVVMLDITPPSFSADPQYETELAYLLGIEIADFRADLPLEIAVGDFTHLIVPVNGLSVMHQINPDYAGLTLYCKRYNIETVAAFCTEVENTNNTIHVRDFCPAVGVAESAAAGTSNAALTAYLVRHELVQVNENNAIIVNAEQGMEINRPSSIRSVAHMKAHTISRLQVGGVATKVMDGQLHLPENITL